MIVIVGAILGVVLGSLAAKRRGGNRLDMLQYAVVYALIFVLVGSIVTLLIHRAAM